MRPRPPSPQEKLEHELRQLLTDSFKLLFEHKHLYQSVRVEAEPILTKMNEELSTNLPAYYSGLFLGAWWPSDPSDNRPALVGVAATESYLDFKSPDVKLHCTKCNGTEAFNNLSSRIVVQDVHPLSPEIALYVFTVQVFVFTFLCQSCKSIPEAFLVRREGDKITLSGRSPIEWVDVPKVIPKPVQKYFSDATVAHQSGQTLAGNFMLRTLIEQWSYSQAGTTTLSADQAIDAYMDNLPADFKSRFPSLRDVYSELSIDIHAATGSVQVFESSVRKITEHFDARRLFKLSGK